jgi:hypothetical protein
MRVDVPQVPVRLPGGDLQRSDHFVAFVEGIAHATRYYGPAAEPGDRELACQTDKYKP